MKMPDPARRLIESGAHAHLVTLNPDGSPQVPVVWAGVDGDDIIAAHLYESKKVRNLRRDGRVAVTFECDTVSKMGLKEYLVVYGEASIEGGSELPRSWRTLSRVGVTHTRWKIPARLSASAPSGSARDPGLAGQYDHHRRMRACR
jgi:PPOX class probable F420-dependent enzyme